MPGSGDSTARADRLSHVVIAGGGVGALEAAFAVRALAGPRVALTLVTPATEFVYRPVAVLEPFVGAAPRRVALARIAHELQAAVVRGHVTAVDPWRRTVSTAAGQRIVYDHCVVAVGARPREPVPGTTALDPARLATGLGPVLDEIACGSLARLGYAVTGPTWPLPAYELALLTRRHAREAGVAPEITLLTDETSPLDLFGPGLSGRVARLLRDADVAVRTRVLPGVPIGDLEQVLALPRLRGPALDGLPANPDGFVPVGEFGLVVGLQDVYAVGDVTASPLKFGGAGALAADLAAGEIAAAIGADVPAHPEAGVARGVMLTGTDPGVLHFELRIEHGAIAEARVREADAGRWADDAKLSARYLGAYLDELWAQGPAWRHAASVG